MNSLCFSCYSFINNILFLLIIILKKKKKVRQWWESYHSDGDQTLFWPTSNNLRALKEDPKKSLAMLELEKKKNLLGKFRG